MAEFKTRSHPAEIVRSHPAEIVVEKKEKAAPTRTAKKSKTTVKAILEEDTKHANPE